MDGRRNELSVVNGNFGSARSAEVISDALPRIICQSGSEVTLRGSYSHVISGGPKV